MKELWCDIRELGVDKINKMKWDVSCVLVVNYNQFSSMQNLQNRIVIAVSCKKEIENIPNKNIILLRADVKELIEFAMQKKYVVAQEYFVEDRKTMLEAAESKADYVIVKLKDITNIPLELILASRQCEKKKVIKVVYSCDDAEIAFGTMETGVDGVMIKEQLITDISLLMKRLGAQNKIAIEKCSVVEITHLGMGSRVCIDTIDLLKENEGCMVGSTVHGAILISSETHYLPYMNLRPFRVNAGAIHSYVMSQPDKTMYLSEIESGSCVLIVDTLGNSRQVTVGRAKVEKRPLVKIGVKAKDGAFNVIVQDDWHIRVFDENGNAKSIMDLQVGDEIMGYFMSGARHVGMRIQENIIEK